MKHDLLLLYLSERRAQDYGLRNRLSMLVIEERGVVKLNNRSEKSTGSIVGCTSANAMGHGLVTVRSESGPPDFYPFTLKVPRSAVGSGSGRPEPAP